MKIFGIIYKITNKLTAEMYIGQTIGNLDDRWKEHCNPNSGCIRIARAIQKYGPDIFDRIIVCYASNLDELNDREEFCIRIFDTVSPNGYNLTSGGNGRILSQESRNKISKSNTGKVRTPEQLQRQSDSHKGNVLHPGQRKKISDSLMGHKGYWLGKGFSEEHRINLSKALKGKAAPNKGISPSEETRKKISVSSTGRIVSEETRARIGNAHRGKTISEEMRQHLSRLNMGKVVPEEVRQKISKSLKGLDAPWKHEPWSEERKKERSEALKEKPWSPARRAANEAKKASKLAKSST